MNASIPTPPASTSIGSQGNALRMVVISVVPPSTVPNDITGFTLHSEGSRLGEQQQNNQ
jgi:hypothetical protein